MAPEAPRLHDAFANNTVPHFPAFGPKTINTVVTGDVATGLAQADLIKEGTYTYENIANPLPIEAPGVIAQWEDANRLTVWCGQPERLLAPVYHAIQDGLSRHPGHQHPLWGQLRIEKLRPPAAVLRRRPGSGNPSSCKILLHQGRTFRRLRPAAGIPLQGQNRYAEGRHHHGGVGRLVHRYGGPIRIWPRPRSPWPAAKPS